MKRNVELYQNRSDRLKLEGETENMGLDAPSDGEHFFLMMMMVKKTANIVINIIIINNIIMLTISARG